MTYLDPDDIHRGPTTGQIVLRVLVVLALVAFGWFALTIGDQDSSEHPEVTVGAVS